MIESIELVIPKLSVIHFDIFKLVYCLLQLGIIDAKTGIKILAIIILSGYITMKYQIMLRPKKWKVAKYITFYLLKYL